MLSVSQSQVSPIAEFRPAQAATMVAIPDAFVPGRSDPMPGQQGSRHDQPAATRRGRVHPAQRCQDRPISPVRAI